MTQNLLPELIRMYNFIQSFQGSESLDSSNMPVHCDRPNLVSPRSGLPISCDLSVELRGRPSFCRRKAARQDKRNFKEQLRVREEVEYEIWEDGGGKISKPADATHLARRAERLHEVGLTGNEPIGI